MTEFDDTRTRDEAISRFKHLVHYSMVERERGSKTGNDDHRKYHEDLILALELAIKYLREDGK